MAAGQRQAAQDRLDRQPGRWRELLAMLALLARPAPPALLAGACGWAPREVLDCLDGLSRTGLVRPGLRGWELTHQEFGQAALGTLGPAGQARAHALLAEALERGGADAAEVAAHRAASGDREGAAAAYATAAAHRLERLSDDEAIRLAEAGLALEQAAPARALLLETRSEAYRRRGLLDEARADLTAALDCCDDAAGRSRALTGLALLDARSVSVARGEDLVELAVAEAEGRPGPLGQALAAGAVIDLPTGNLARAERRFRRARQLLEEAGETRGSARLLY